MLLFSKMHGLGNDFIVINCINQYFNYNLGILSKFLCNRNYGIGADGVIFAFYSSNADFKMRIFNSDGTEAENCGNGIRVLGKYLYEKNLTTKKELKIETLAGIKNIELDVQRENVNYVKVDMGKANFDAEKIPAFLPKTEFQKAFHKVNIKIENKDYIFDLVSVGNPHAVCFLEKINEVNISKIGPIVENYKFFPNKINVEFVEVINKSTLKIKVWERGVGITKACGTGACAAVVCANKENLVENNVIAELDGGKLYISLVDKRIFMTGPAEFVFDGRIDL